MEVSLIDQIERIYIERDAQNSDVAKRVVSFFGATHPIEIVDQRPLQDREGRLSAREYDQSKRHLYVTNFKGAFFKRCPGSKPGLSCCNYFVLNLGQQCNMNCSYCYLQSFINSPLLTIYANVDQALDELREMAVSYPDLAYRVGTGEITDSLSMDDVTLYSRKLIPFFREFPKWTLEFKTKSAKVDQFLDVPHAGNVIASWSINPQFVVEHEEHGTASLEQRLLAARKCRDRGFVVAFHIDPMIWHEDWKKNYSELVTQVVQQFKPEEVRWVTVGALRFQPEQRIMMRERFGMKSLVTQAEVFPSSEGKLRYDLHLRNEMFQYLLAEFRAHSPAWRVSLCMENKESWVNTMSTTARKVPELTGLFDPLPQKPKKAETWSAKTIAT